MTYTFYKYQGTGNDFILIDNRLNVFDKNNANLVAAFCDRRFGIGADGLILLENHSELDFSMVYFNSDGHTSSMCGNGGRCIVSFAKFLGIIQEQTAFMAIDGIHHARIDINGIVELQMADVPEVEVFQDHLFLDTGSPHHIQLTDGLDELDVKVEGSNIRHSQLYGTAGSNINFVEQYKEAFKVRTYERGVEDETLSCGTGVTAVALAMHFSGATVNREVILKTRGGQLKVRFDPLEEGYVNVWLIGEAKQVFKGAIEW